MNRRTLRFLGMQHDRIRHDGGTQVERDALLATIDRLAEDTARQPRMFERVRLRIRKPGSLDHRTVTITSVTPFRDRVEIGWMDDRGEWGSFAQRDEAQGPWGTTILGAA
jgi:hypothetical protein